MMMLGFRKPPTMNQIRIAHVASSGSMVVSAMTAHSQQGKMKERRSSAFGDMPRCLRPERAI